MGTPKEQEPDKEPKSYFQQKADMALEQSRTQRTFNLHDQEKLPFDQKLNKLYGKSLPKPAHFAPPASKIR